MAQSNEPIESFTFVVTGAAGFIGAHLVQHLLNAFPNAQIRAFDSLTYAGDEKRLYAALKSGRVLLTKACILDEVSMLAACKDADVIFHLAAESYVGKSFIDEAIFQRTNVEGTTSVLFAALTQGVKHVIHFSTDEVYGARHVRADENTELAPTSPYAKSKVDAEREVKRFQSLGLDVRVLRPNNVVGTGQHIEKLIPKFIDAGLRGKPFTLEGSGLQTRTFLPVSDLCSAAIMILRRAERNSTFNVCGRETKTVLQVAEMIAASCGCIARFKPISDRPINDFGYPLNGEKLASLGWVQLGNMQTEIDKEIASRRATAAVTSISGPHTAEITLVPNDNAFEHFPTPIAFHCPYRATEERAYLDKVMNADTFAGGGAQTKQAELRLAQLTGARQVRLTHSCTAALEIAALAINLSQGDEVIIPAFTFCATATAFAAAGAKLVFCDIDPNTLMIDPTDFARKITNKTRAVAVVHYGGNVADMAQLLDICNSHNIHIIEDAAQAIGVRLKGQHAGSFGLFGALSFHETKVLQSGNGGALLINSTDADLLSRIDTILNRGTDFEKMRRGEQSYYQWDGHGSSYRPTEFQAALIQAQLQDLPSVLDKRLHLAQRYIEHLQKIDGPFHLVQSGNDVLSNHHCMVLLAHNEVLAADLLAYLKSNKISALQHYAPLSSSNESIRRGEDCNCPQTEALWSRLVRLPIHTQMTDQDVDYICHKLTNWLSAIQYEANSAKVHQTA